ncbi:hypothetical protein NDU88_003486 [Pleurodeles waltl]|uniref:Uncharacterized protein n=1 Tax=Pleurodeles waltl TaxID=8319 RepID=A0AAV7QF15_PLEWA|nr:hypothetical protein NDU88_003486 [Pleurodeles waltl]
MDNQHRYLPERLGSCFTRPTSTKSVCEACKAYFHTIDKAVIDDDSDYCVINDACTNEYDDQKSCLYTHTVDQDFLIDENANVDRTIVDKTIVYTTIDNNTVSDFRIIIVNANFVNKDFIDNTINLH